MKEAVWGMVLLALAGLALSVVLWVLAGKRCWLLFLPVFLVVGMGRAGLERQTCQEELALGLDGQEILLTGRLEAVRKREKGWVLELTDCDGWLYDQELGREAGAAPAPDIQVEGLPSDRSEKSSCKESGDLKTRPDRWRLRRVQVYTDEDIKGVRQLEVGNILQVRGEADEMEPARNPGQFEFRQYYRAFGQSYRIMADSFVVQSRERRALDEFLRRQVLRAGEILDQTAPAGRSGLFRAVLLGDKTALEAKVRDMYQDHGIAHLLAVSGLHLSLLGGAVYGGLRLLGAGYGSSGLVSGLFLAAYSVMIGSPASVERALVMTLCGYGAAYLGRSFDLLSALALSALLLLWASPYLVLQAGFQLSFGALLGIGVASPCLERWLIGDKELSGEFLWCKSLAAALGIQLVTVPVQLYHFYQIPLWGMALNLVLVPLMGLVLASGVAGVVLGSVSIRAGRFAMGSGAGILSFYEWACGFSDRFPGNLLVAGRPQGWQMTVYYLILAAVLSLAFYGNRESWPAAWKRLLPAMGTGFLVLVLAPRPVKGLEVTFLDVGQGDGICLQTRDYTVLVDGGSSDEKELGSYRLEPFLKSQARTRIDYAVVSHGDMDHISGLFYLLEEVREIKICHLVLPAAGQEDAVYEKLEGLVTGSGGRVLWMEQGDVLSLGGLSLTCLYPDSSPREDRNEQSLVLRADYKAFHMLLTGDMSLEGEAAILDSPWGQGLLSDIQVLKVAHHGSDSSTGGDWLGRIQPGFAVISYGEGNRYGHPKQQVMERLGQIGSVIYETAVQGAVTVYTDGATARFRTFLER